MVSSEVSRSTGVLEETVKKSLQTIILAFIYYEPKCGFDMIKEIVQQFNVLLSQGTVYPLLYSLEEKGLLKTELKEDNKTKIYLPTEKGKAYIKEQVREYVHTHESIINLILKGAAP